MEKEFLKGRKTVRSKEYSTEVKEEMRKEISRLKKLLKSKVNSFYKGARIIGFDMVGEK